MGICGILRGFSEIEMIGSQPMKSIDLGKLPLFSGLSDSELSKLTARSRTKSFRPHSYILHEGDDSDSLYIILSGSVDILVTDSDGRELVINDQGPGEYFGELALFDNDTRSASVVSREETQVLVISKAAVHGICDQPEKLLASFLENHPEITVRIVKDLMTRVRVLTSKLKSFGLFSVRERIIELINRVGKPTDQGIALPKLTHQEIAQRVGASREMVTRIIGQLKQEGVIEVSNHQIILLKFDLLIEDD